MKPSEIINFMNPFDDALSTIFVCSLILLAISTLIWLLIQAKPENWEKNWHGGDLDDCTNNLDSEHGSINELSDAVATKTEKIADIMPSMLLIIGLLGTFIGLGIALNKASTVLMMADTTGMDGAMSQLMGMMEGLGAKFKTSTWGILCFILLNVAFNIIGYKEKRLAWCIRRVRHEIETRKQDKKKEESNRYNQFLNTLKDLVEITKDNSLKLNDTITTIYDEVRNNQLLINNKLLPLLSMNQKVMNDCHKKTMKLYIDQHNEKVVQNDKIIDALNTLQTESREHSNTVINKVCQAIEITNNTLKSSAEKSLSELQKSVEYNRLTQESMQNFVDKTMDSINSMSGSADKMGEAAELIGNSAKDLNSVVENFHTEMKNVMAIIKRDLGETINNMGSSFEQTLNKMSEDMGQATEGISKAVFDLSVSVDKTMTEVTGAITESMDLQMKSANEFTITSSTLNEQIFSMTDLVNKLSGDITSGLKAVSESSRRMKSLDTRYERYSEVVENLTKTNSELNLANDKMLKVNEELVRNLSNVTDSHSNEYKNLNNTIQSIKNILSDFSQAKEIIEELNKTLIGYINNK